MLRQDRLPSGEDIRTLERLLSRRRIGKVDAALCDVLKGLARESYAKATVITDTLSLHDPTPTSAGAVKWRVKGRRTRMATDDLRPLFRRDAITQILSEIRLYLHETTIKNS